MIREEEFPERRKEQYFCDGHPETRETLILLKNNLRHLTEAVNRIDIHLAEAAKIRINWWIALLGVVIGLFVQTCVFSYNLGLMGNQIEVNTKRLTVIEELHASERKQ